MAEIETTVIPSSVSTHSELTGVGVNDHHAQIHATQHATGGDDTLALGKLLQVITAETASVLTTTTTMFNDNTIPQNTEGGEFETVTITPVASDSRLLISGSSLFDSSATVPVIFAVFVDDVANAIWASAWSYPSVSIGETATWEFFHSPGDTDEHIYKLRIGPHSTGTITYNGADSGNPRFGTAGKSTMTVQEFAA